MSELKVYVMPLKTNIFGQTIVGQAYYSKSDADKVIAELKHDVAAWMDSYEVSRKTNARTESELRYQKYKRCLAMAEMCKARYDEEDAKVNGCGASWEYISNKMKYWERWRDRWLELAEKFKDKETK